MKNIYDIFGIGLPRTGSSSLAKALRTLGYKGENYCMLQNQEFKEEKPSFRVDNSFFNIYKELFLEYPNSKFILTTREDNSWRESINKFSMITKSNAGLPHINIYTQEVLKFFSNCGALRNLLVVDLFDNNCNCECKWKNLYEFLGFDSQIPMIKKLGIFPHVISW